MQLDVDTICAVATPPGRGGVGIIRVSGPRAIELGQIITGRTLRPRYAHYGPFTHGGEILDEGLCISFPAPNSFTGEDVVEFQGHGGPILLDRIIKALNSYDIRLARPGEFSERAFLNGKLDLAQAEAISDLINASTEQAARGALQSLDGVFSRQIHALVDELIHLRVYVEAAIDFPEEEIDFLSDGNVQKMAEALVRHFNEVQKAAKHGALLRDGMTVVIAGRPNAGKSSLLNALTGKDTAIVTNIAGTTRDVLHEDINLDGMPLHIIDTAGLRNAPDVVEQEGIRRAQNEMTKADHILVVVDSSASDSATLHDAWPSDVPLPPTNIPHTLILNKADLANHEIRIVKDQSEPLIYLSAATGQGINLLREHLKTSMNYQAAGEGAFMARRRHIDALERARNHLDFGLEQLFSVAAGELFADDLRQAQQALSEITGRFTSDDLLGEIFGSFCIGK